MLLDGLRTVLVKTRFPENIGMVARAQANMGCPELWLVQPERWDYAKAEPLATPKGKTILDRVELRPDLASAIADTSYVLGTTARTGGWRKKLLHPGEAAQSIVKRLQAGERVALVFGPEDRGLENSEICACHDLISIPTDQASSLNLAQAVLLLLYVCAEERRKNTRSPHKSKSISHGDLDRFLEHFKAMLIALDCLHGDNIEYFFLPWRRLFARMELSRSEYDALMGLCRQVRRKIGE
ncbi:MAG: RNA methyltransferase [Desulfovibrio sp.]|nr:RNA methyltransferase [Desulfovibrio sp.]